MITMVRNAGSATAKSLKSISAICLTIIAPTTTRAAAAASIGTAWYSGVKNMAAMNSRPVTTFARPVRAPSPMPEADSTNTVLELADAAPPAMALAESMNSPLPTLGSCPFLSTRRAS